jgi:hypothetical protein
MIRDVIDPGAGLNNFSQVCGSLTGQAPFGVTARSALAALVVAPGKLQHTAPFHSRCEPSRRALFEHGTPNRG